MSAANQNEIDKTKISEVGGKEKQVSPASKVDKYLLPSNQDYLSYYVYQEEWKPTKPLKPVGAVFKSPGPAIVNLPSTIGTEHFDPTKPRAPSYKMGMKLKRLEQQSIGPGPGAYDVNAVCKVTNAGRENPRAPKIGKAQRFRQIDGVYSPGPAAYNRDACDKLVYPAAPSFTMAHSQRGKTKTPFSPAPNAYSLPSAIGTGMGPSYSMGKSKRMPAERAEVSPGPAAYSLPSTNVNMSKPPAFYIGRKVAPPSRLATSPGPGAHASHLVKFDKFSTPRITFGIKHSPYKILPGFAAEK